MEVRVFVSFLLLSALTVTPPPATSPVPLEPVSRPSRAWPAFSAPQAKEAVIITEFEGRRVVAGRALLKFKAPPGENELASLASDTFASYLEPLGGAGWYRLDSSKFTVDKLISTLRSNPLVLRAEPDFVGRPEAVVLAPTVHRPQPMMFTVPNDPNFSLQWGLQNTGQTVGGVAGTPGADINAAAAWAISTGSHHVVIVDFDTGIDYNNPDLAANVWTAPSAYAVYEGGNSYPCPPGSHGFNAMSGYLGCNVYDNGADYGHGTLTAGVLGAVGNNGVGVSGTNWGVTILPITICGSTCTSSDAVVGIDAAMQIAAYFGLDVVAGNISHGTLGGGVMEDEIVTAGSNGMAIAASTGNECLSGADDPASFHLNNELAVAASDQSDQRAYWSGGCSNGGGDIAAPGRNIYTTILGDDGTHPLHSDGTSVAAPFVTGAMGLLASVCPLTAPGLVATLKGTADQISALSSIATNGRRLNLGNALASCTGGGRVAGSGTLDIYFYEHSDPVDTGSLVVTIDGTDYSVSYDTSRDTEDTVGQRLARVITYQGWVTATYTGYGEISLTTDALGPYTGYMLSAGVQDDCGAFDDCGPAPEIDATGFTAGH